MSTNYKYITQSKSCNIHNCENILEVDLGEAEKTQKTLGSTKWARTLYEKQ